MPLCMLQFANPIVKQSKYLKEKQRLTYYRMLASLHLPGLSHSFVVRHMMSYSGAKTAEHYKEALAGYEKMAEKCHRSAAQGYRRISALNGREVDSETAQSATTCAPSCSSLVNAKKYGNRHSCPLTWSNKQEMIEIMKSAGVPLDRAKAIAESPNNAATRCRMVFESSRRPSTQNVPAFTQKTINVYPKHPYNYTYLAAEHLLRSREGKKLPTNTMAGFLAINKN